MLVYFVLIELIQYTPVPVIFVNGISRTKAFGSVGINYEKCGILYNHDGMNRNYYV